MKKFVFFLLAFFLCFSFLLFLSYSLVKAENEFETDIRVNYEVKTDGTTKITHDVTLTNVFSHLYATSYTLVLEGLDPQNPQASQDGIPIDLEIDDPPGDQIGLKVSFPDAVVGKGKTRQFKIVFEEDSLANKTGEVWEVTIPKLNTAEAFDSFEVNLVVPTALGKLAYISPSPTSQKTEAGLMFFNFEKQKIAENGVTAAFGEFQVFSFDLTYHLENPLNRQAKIDIAIPPDTAFQKVIYESLEPRPSQVYLDEDGNWLATYFLKPRERLDVQTQGAVQLFSQKRSFLTPSVETLDKNTLATEYWQVDDPEIIALAQKLKTPRSIYNYIVGNFKYDLSRVKPNIARLGAKEALSHPEKAICMEFTDAFIALARAAGIPAREINGFAYTENPEIQPLSLVADVLHSWPEYWDEEQRIWVPIDPTWAYTTGGVDYFNKLDLRHFTFVIHGTDVLQPYPPGSYKLGANPQKDVFVSFAQLPQERVAKPEIKIKFQKGIPFLGFNYQATVSNPGPVALYNQEVLVYFDQELVSRKPITALPPFGQTEVKIQVPFSFLGLKMPEEIKILLGTETVVVPTAKLTVTIATAALIFFSLLGIGLVILFKVKKIQVQKLVPKKLKK